MTANRWIEQYLSQIPAFGMVLDLASGNGRHAQLALQHGYAAIAVDKDISGIDCGASGLQALPFDLEAGRWPFPPGFFDGVIVCNYLHRQLMSHIAQALQPDGVLLYTTFMQGNENYGRPRNPDYLLRPDELRTTFKQGFTEIAFEQGLVETPVRAMRQSICVRKQSDSSIVRV